MRARNMQRLTEQLEAKYQGVVIYGIGDDAHKRSPSDHNEDDTPGSKAEQQDADDNPEHRAIDVMIGRAFAVADAWALVAALVTIAANQARLKYVIFDGWIWRRNGGWAREVYTQADKHRDHPHVSGLAADDENGADWVLEVRAPEVPKQGEGEETIMYFFTSNHDDKGPRWAVVTGGCWVEYDSQVAGDALAAGLGHAPIKGAGAVSATQCPPDTYAELRQPFDDAGRVMVGGVA